MTDRSDDPLTSGLTPSMAYETAPLEDSLSYKITVIADLIARRVSHVATTVGGLNLSQWRVLAAIGDQDGRTASQVVDMTPIDKGIVSRAVSSLITQGYLRRRASDNDGRVSHLYMTASGRRTYERIAAELDRVGATAETLIPTSRRESFLADLDRIIEGFPSQTSAKSTAKSP